MDDYQWSNLFSELTSAIRASLFLTKTLFYFAEDLERSIAEEQASGWGCLSITVLTRQHKVRGINVGPRFAVIYRKYQ